MANNSNRPFLFALSCALFTQAVKKIFYFVQILNKNQYFCYDLSQSNVAKGKPHEQ